MRSQTKLLVAAAAIALLALGLWLFAARRSTAPPVALPPPTPDAPLRASGVDDEPLVTESSTAPPRAVSTGETTAAEEPARPERPPRHAGKLRVRAVDARTNAPLANLRVRAASATRIADRSRLAPEGEVLLTLTPGSYQVLVLSPGYEPVELGLFEVVQDGELAPDPARLQPASARILGVGKREAADDRPLQAELFGAGRNPCADCSKEPSGKPCPRCGYAAASSLCTLTPEGSFTFENLSGGRYALRLVDAQGRVVGLPQALELAPFQVRTVELDAPSLRAVELELVDCDGAALAGEWAERLRGPVVEPELISASGPSLRFECRFRSGETSVAKTEFEVPLEPGQSGSRGSGHSRTFTGRKTGGGTALVDDRSRSAKDALRPEVPLPVVPEQAVRAYVEQNGCVHFEPLPALDLVLELSCGPYSARVSVPSSAGTTRLRAQLLKVDDSAEEATFREYEARLAR